MEDIVYNIRQFLRILNDSRASVLTIWRDNAERDISRRYVDPLFDAADAIQTTSEYLKYCIDEATHLCDVAQERCRDARDYSVQICELLQDVESELSNAEQEMQSIDQKISELRTACENICNLLSDANGVGDSASSQYPASGLPNIFALPVIMLEKIVKTTVNMTVNAVYSAAGLDPLPE